MEEQIHSKAKPVTILTGFLGSGKTTFLNQVIKHFPEKRFAIIENEVGAEGIDGELVTKADDGLFEMNNGCLCCSLNDNLIELLQKLYNRAEKFDELIIETTGIADPAGVAAAFWQVPGIEQFYQLRRIICLIDSPIIEDQLEETEEAIAQISFSDALLINKSSSVSPSYISKLSESLTQLNPLAKLFEEKNSHFPISELWKHEREDILNARDKVEHPPHKHFKHGKITALSFRFENAFDIEELQNRLLVFLMFQASSIYRVKGIVYAHGYSRKLIIQSVRTSIAVTIGKKWEENESKESRIVVIGKEIKSAGFEKMFKTCFYKNQKGIVR